ncbi:MAG: sigma-70 family RNA polymerase sigma factor [Kribbellaceae bacterium]
MDALQAPSDAELIARVRGGDLEAYGELFERHHRAAERMARQLVPAADVDDLAGDAFAKVLEALRSGGGPDVSFRAYLLTTVRRVHVDRIRAAKRVTSTDDIASYEREPETFDDPTLTGFESGAAAQAFAALPERWQAVLWHTEVEGEKPAAVAPLLGLTPNGVSALAYRAREGLRQAYLQQHLADVANDRCRWATERLGAYVRGGLTKRENKHMREHIDECAKCTALYLELVEVNSALPALLAPVLLGTAAAGYLTATGVKVGGAGILVSLWQKATENGTRTAVTAGSAAAVAAAGLITVFALSGGEDPQAETPPAAIQGSEPPGPTVPPATQPPKQPSQPTSGPTSQPIQPTAAPTEGPTSPPTTGPTQSPSVPAPVLDEGLLTIDTPTGGNGGRAVVADAAVPSERRRLNVAPAPGMSRVTVQIRYGTRLGWPVAGNPPGWTCVSNRPARTGLCTAANPADPAPLTIEFDSPNGGARRDRTFTATARTYAGSSTSARYFDDDSDMVVPAGRNDDLLDVSKGSGTARTLRIVPPEENTDPVVVEIEYGAALSWPVTGSPAGWTCSAAARTCTARDRQDPASLPLRFVPPEGGSDAERTYTVTVRVGRVYDLWTETLKSVFDPEKLLRVQTTAYGHHLYKVDFTVTPPARYDGTVTLTIEFGADLFWTYRDASGWSCRSDPHGRTVRCITKNTGAAGPLRGHLHLINHDLRYDARLSATATAGSVADTDSYADIRGRAASGSGSSQEPVREPVKGRLTDLVQPMRTKRFARR